VANPTSRAEFYANWPPKPGETGTPLPLSASWDDPNRASIRLPGNAAGHVLLRDASAAGWEAFADGKPVPPSGVILSPISRVVRVASGVKEVTWEYRPPSLALGWKLLAVGLLALLGLLIGDGVRSRKRVSLSSSS
jgi:hypothetical protein